MTLLAFLAGCAALCAGQLPPSPSPSDLPVSVERVRERLRREPALKIPPERKVDFRASVSEEFTPPETVLEAVRRALAGDVHTKPTVPGTISPALVSVDLLQIAMAVKRQLSGALRVRAERNARDEVAAALAEFCASHDCSVLEQELKQSNPEGVLTH